MKCSWKQVTYQLHSLHTLNNARNSSLQIIARVTLSPYLTGMETSWRPVGDSSLRGSRRRRHDVSWRFGGSRGSRGEIKHVRFFLRLFGDFFKSPVDLGDVAATSQRLNMFSRRKTSPRRLRDVSETSPRLGGVVSATTIDLLL